jgi:aspartate/methionine/tyrosine aminotransferase
LGDENGEETAKKLWQHNGIKVLPGAYLSRTVDGVNPGHNYVRIALVDPDVATIRNGLLKIRERLALSVYSVS